MSKQKQLSIRLSDSLLEELKKEAKAQHRNLSNYIELLLIKRKVK